MIMERKIGEIFEYNGEWCQCIVGNDCENCAFNERKCYTVVDNGDPIGDCCADRRKDNKDVIFKKIEKVGEPYTTSVDKTVQNYLLETAVSIPPKDVFTLINNEQRLIAIEIKQNKEDMEEKGITLDDAIKYCSDAGKQSASIDCKIINYKIRDWLTELKQYKDKERFNSESTEKDLKPFSLEAAEAGKPVCTRGGRKVRIICFDAKGMHQPIIALITQDNGVEYIETYYSNGRFNDDSNSQSDNDLMMLPEKKEGWVNVYREESNNNERLIGQTIYKTRKDAFDNACPKGYITTTKINWEE